MKYYLFMHKQKDLDDYKIEFLKCLESIESGETPVLNEIRCTKTMLVKKLLYHLFHVLVLTIGAVLFDGLNIDDTLKIALVLSFTTLCCIALLVIKFVCNEVITSIKHYLRVKLCNRLGIEATERNIAVMESLEYQSV